MTIKLSVPRMTDEEAVDKFLAGLRDSHARIHIKDNIDMAEPVLSEAIRAAHTYEGNRLDAVSGGSRGVSAHMNDLQVDDPMDLSVVERRELYNMMKSWNNSGGRGSAQGGTRGGFRGNSRGGYINGFRGGRGGRGGQHQHSGASANYISPHLLSAVTQLRCVNGQAVETANGHQSVISSIATFSLQLGGYKDDMEAYVFQTKFDHILGNSWLRQEMKSKSRPRLNNHDHDLESRVDAEVATNAIGINGDAVMIGSARDREMVDDGVAYIRTGNNIDGSGANASVEEEVDVGPEGIVEVDDCDFVISARQFERLLKKGQVEECFLVSSRELCDLLDLNNMDNVGLSDQNTENEI
ncbi:hypothetical protein [Parasitella parasitica]|uniref:Uncharacterized protein n=1 Tax=Parasitella parasitica TaxID=35722 RepID=A0A0B7NKJ9_9FUNG|nr:hypothetical protein [Parasitella parasitica]